MWSIAENGQNLFSFLVHMLLQYDLSTSPIKCLFLNLLNVDLATELPLTKVEAWRVLACQGFLYCCPGNPEIAVSLGYLAGDIWPSELLTPAYSEHQ